MFEQLAAIVVPRAGASATRLFTLVFVLSLGTAAVLNNDAAILVLTPVVVLLVRQLYPDTPSLLLPFAFAVFMAAGVAPFVTSNPMNTVVAGVAEIDFNEYAARMLPVALAGSVVTFFVLRSALRRRAGRRARPRSTAGASGALDRRAASSARARARRTRAPIPSSRCGSAGLRRGGRRCRHRPRAVLAPRCGQAAEVLRTAVAWEILFFLVGMFLLAQGLQNVGVVDRLTDLYEETGAAVIGVTSAIGSALINNHSMALTNLLAIEELHGADQPPVPAGARGRRPRPAPAADRLAGGPAVDRPPRQMGVEVPLRRFVTVGVAVTVPSLAVSLAVLALFLVVVRPRALKMSCSLVATSRKARASGVG